MHNHSKRLASGIALITPGLVFLVVASLAAQQHDAAGHHHPDAAKIVNPVAADAVSVAAGKKLFKRYCSSCHGDAAKGDGDMGEAMDPKPANLTDADWKHGSSDGEIFAVIQNGTKGTGMKPFGRKITAHQTWDVINFVHTLASPPATSR